MKKNKCYLAYLLLFLSTFNYGQKIEFDSSNVIKADFCGYNASNFINPNARFGNNGLMSPQAMPKASYPANAIFDCGAFRLYYEDIALSTGDGFDDPVNGATSRATLCAVYQYIQNTFNFTNIPTNDPITIEIERSFTGSNPPVNAGVLATAGPVYPNSAAPGIYNGSLLNHFLTNVSPNVNLFDARLQVNFVPQNPTTNALINYHLPTTLPVTNCSTDLFTVLLHEVGHQLGFGSLLRENAGQQPISAFGNNQYTLFDWQNIWHGNINTPATFEKIVTGSLLNPQINPLIANSTNYLRDESLWLNGNGRFLGNIPIYSGVFGNSVSSLAIGSVASHICGDYLSFTERFSLSPGYRKAFVMSPSIDVGEVKRQYTDEEIRIFLNLGYVLNPIFANSMSINGVTPNSNIILSNRAPVTTKQVTSNLINPTFPDLVQPADFTIINNGTPLNISLSADPTISDVDGDIVRVENNSLFNIRGCSNNGNNHSCLTTNALGNIITYTPRPNFIGRAQFGFYLNDGNERGSFMVYTIDVLPGSSFVNTPNINTPIGNNELIVNGDFEELSEIKIAGNALDENLLNTSHQFRREEGLYFSGVHFSDAHPLQYINWLWTSGGGELIRNSQKNCNAPINPYSFGANPFSFPNGIWNPPVSTIGNGYSYITGNHNYHTLATSLQTCHRYIANFDVNFQNSGLPIGSVYTVNLNFHSSVLFPTNPSLQSTPVSVIVGTGWQTITVPFVYCSSTPPNFLNFIGSGFIFYDNVSLIEDLSPAPPLIANAAASNLQLCFGNSTNLLGSATNNFCNTTYVWQPGNLSGPSVSITPSTNTTYTLTVNDGCRTATSVITITVNPLPTISIVASPSVVCPTSPSSTLTASGGATYTWQPGNIIGNPITVNPTSTTIYTVTGTDANGCSNSAQVTVATTTCASCNSCNPIATSGVFPATITSANVYCINNNVTVSGTRILIGSDFKIAANVKISVASNGVLIISNSHLYACGDMWQGIEVQNGGRLIITNSLIEDAKMAIDVTNNTQTNTALPPINLTNTTFNKNYVSVNINNYRQQIVTYPFTIRGCVFTCRNIAFTNNSFPTATTIKATAPNAGAPYTSNIIDNTIYSQTTNAGLKAPYAGQKSNSGIVLTNVGAVFIDNLPIIPVMILYNITIGSPNNQYTNVFDNQKYGINTFNSGLNSVNNVYQNTANITKGNAGYGIYAVCDQTYIGQVIAKKVNNFNNQFIDCGTGVNTEYCPNVEVTDNLFKTSKLLNTANGNPIGGKGVNGVNIKVTDVTTINVSSNQIANYENGIVLNQVGTSPLINWNPEFYYLDNNIISAKLNGQGAITTQYVKNAIIAQTLNPEKEYAGVLSITNNQISNVYRGIYSGNWADVEFAINDNTIDFVPDAINASNPTYGINLVNNYADGRTPANVVNNSITGYSNLNPAITNVDGISCNASFGIEVGCNTTKNTNYGLRFSGFCYKTGADKNIMDNNQYGFVLDNNALVGKPANPFSIPSVNSIGGPNQPADNKWQGTWTGSRFKTYTNNSFAQNSPMYVDNSNATTNPDLSAYSSPINALNEYHNFNGSLIYTTGTNTTVCNIVPKTNNGNGGNNANSIINNGNTNTNLLERVVQNQVTIPNNATETQHIQHGQVYRLLKKDNALMANSSVLQNFYSTSQTSNEELFFVTEQQLAGNNLSNAAGNIAALSSANTIDANNKTYAQSLMHYKDSTYTESDSSALVELANKCPFTDGLVVFKARALYNIAHNTVDVFNDNCNVTMSSSRIGKTSTTTTDNLQQLNIDLFPNPTNDKFNIITDVADSQLTIQILDIQGKTVFTDNITVANYQTTVQANLTNGVYIVNISNTTNGTKAIKKLVIQK